MATVMKAHGTRMGTICFLAFGSVEGRAGPTPIVGEATGVQVGMMVVAIGAVVEVAML